VSDDGAETIGADESIGEDKIWYLRKNRLFANVPIDAVVDAAGIFTMQLLPKRATFFDQGDAEKVVFLIKTGRVRISRNTADGKEVTVAILGPGDMFGEDALFGDAERTALATCMEETLICKAHADDLFGLLSGNSALALNVAQMLSDRLGDASATIEDLAYAKISDRLVHLFDRLANEHGRPTPEGTFLDVRLTHQEIASIIGSTRETVSLEMNALVRAGQIKQEGGYITVLARKG
jgi:CRP/FNR family transcriptional regulator, cyclic AMP receptor protein